MVEALETLPNLNEQQLRMLAAELIAKISQQGMVDDNYRGRLTTTMLAG
jgi:uncharacterized protein YneF (UPF0154 family)